jgi:hypothetical protein
VLKKLAIIFSIVVSFNPATGFGEVLWQSPEWSINKRDPQNREQDYSCELVGEKFNIIISAKDGGGTLQLPILDGQGNVPNVEFSIYITFDGTHPQLLSANHVAEFETTEAAIPDLNNFLKLFAHSKSIDISGGGVDRKVDLTGSRAVANVLQKCLGGPNL